MLVGLFKHALLLAPSLQDALSGRVGLFESASVCVKIFRSLAIEASAGPQHCPKRGSVSVP